ncbi:MAG: bifunctional nuclease family protein, partial [Dehalococcoidia bacterium]
ERVVIDRLEDTTFHAKAIVKAREGQKEIDCRASDAMAMAVRKGVPIMAAEEVLSKAGVVLESSTESSGPPPEGTSDEQSTT